MHILQPKHTKLNEKEVQELLERLNIAKVQLPKILSSDPSLPEGCAIGDVIKIDRKEGEKVYPYFRVVV
ncbi:MAG TPA: DNA-directed RNA polymerase subunit RpoH/Rpb5 C-terminal domain-containing protein [Patescibacteria group bacterium]|nr:DNA-directed RNA polymerase subunit RpoH/Rpb5 C-terminal domain-containing protein [Patescibacteria group bacterium]